MMTENEFRQLLKEKGFDQPVLVEREPETHLHQHTHPFEAMALILEGDITICKEIDEITYSTGDVFHLLINEPHHEYFGKRGVKYLSGRKG